MITNTEKMKSKNLKNRANFYTLFFNWTGNNKKKLEKIFNLLR